MQDITKNTDLNGPQTVLTIFGFMVDKSIKLWLKLQINR